MNITPLNTASYKSVNFSALNQKKSTQNKAITAVDNALSQNTGLEMLSIINSASILAKKNNTSIQDELNKMSASFSIIKKMNKDPKAAELTGKILSTEFAEDNQHENRINSQKAIIENQVAFLSDVLKNRNFIKFRKNALAISNRISGFELAEIKSNGFRGQVGADKVTIAQTERTPRFDYCFSNDRLPERAKMTNYLTNDCAEEYTYVLDKKGRLNTSAPIKVRQYNVSNPSEEVITTYAWKKDGDKLSLYCTKAQDNR